MFVVDTLRHNRFKEVDVPSPSELYKKLGFGRGTEKSSGQEFLNPEQNKIDQAAAVQSEIDNSQEEE